MEKKAKKSQIQGINLDDSEFPEFKTWELLERWDPTTLLKFEPDVNRLFEPNGRASGCQFLRPVTCHKDQYVEAFR